MKKLIQGFAVLLICVACGGGSDSTAPISAFGTYNLSAVNLDGLPAVIHQESGLKFEVTGGSITISNDLKYSATVRFRRTQGTTVTNPEWKSSGIMKGTSQDYSFHENSSTEETFNGTVTSTEVRFAADIPKSVINIPDAVFQIFVFTFRK